MAMQGRVSKIFAVLLLGALLFGLFGIGLQSGQRCSIFGCPLTAGVFAAAGTQVAQFAFALFIGFIVLSAAASIALPFVPALSVFRIKVKPSGASQNKFRLWRSLLETSPTAA